MANNQSCLDYLLKSQPEIALQIMQVDKGKWTVIDSQPEDLSSCDCWWIDGFCFDDNWRLWVDQQLERRLFLVFDEISSLHAWLDECSFAPLITSPKITLLCIGGPGKVSKEDLKQYIWSSPGFDIALFDPRSVFKGFFEYCQSLVFLRKAVIREMMKLGAWNWPHIFRRVLDLKKDKKLAKDPFWSQIPICIVGAGVSVGENAHLLGALKNRALVMSAGTAINVLEALSTAPHVAMTIDPFRAQYSRFIQVAGIEIPLIAGWRSHFQAVDCMKGERILLPGSYAYPLTTYWEEKCEYHCAQVEEGLNVVTSAMSVASYLGVNEIFLMGVDLCLRQNTMYGAQVAPTEAFYQPPALHHEETIVLEHEGEKIVSYAKWLSEADWISQFSTHFISVWRNKTHHLPIENTLTVETQDWMDTLVPRDYEAWLWAYLQGLEPVCEPETASWLKSLKEELQETSHWLISQKREIEALLESFSITLLKAPAAETAFSPVSTQIECMMEMLQSDLQDKALYPLLLENWAACFNRVFLPAFEHLRQQQEGVLGIDAWLLLKKIQFLIEGIEKYLAWLDESIKGQFFSEVDEI